MPKSEFGRGCNYCSVTKPTQPICSIRFELFSTRTTDGYFGAKKQHHGWTTTAPTTVLLYVYSVC